MKRTAWLQDRKMQKFRDVMSRWERKELSANEAGELLGISERQFRRYRLPRDNQDENPATIRMRKRRCRGDSGRATPSLRHPGSGAFSS